MDISLKQLKELLMPGFREQYAGAAVARPLSDRPVGTTREDERRRRTAAPPECSLYVADDDSAIRMRFHTTGADHLVVTEDEVRSAQSVDAYVGLIKTRWDEVFSADVKH